MVGDKRRAQVTETIKTAATTAIHSIGVAIGLAVVAIVLSLVGLGLALRARP